MSNVASAYRWSAFALVTRLFIQVVGSILIARVLGPEEFGLAAQATAVGAVLFVVAGFAFNGSLQARNEVDKSWVRQVILRDLYVNIALSFLVIVGSVILFSIGNVVLAKMFLVLLIAIFGQTISGFAVASLSRTLKFREIGYSELVGPLVGVIVGVSLAVGGFGAIAIAWQYAVTELIIGALTVTYAARNWRKIFEPLRGATDFDHRYSLKLTAAQILTQSWRNLDNVMIGLIMGASTLGAYSVSYRLITVTVTAFGGVIGRVSLPALRRSLDTSREEAAHELVKILSGVVLIGTPVCGLIFAWSDYFVEFLFGSQWSSAVPILMVLAVSAPFQLIMVICAPALHVLGRSNVVVKSNIGLCLWVFLSVPLLARLGIFWVSAGIAAGCVVLAISYVEICRRDLDIQLSVLYVPLSFGLVTFAMVSLLGSISGTSVGWGFVLPAGAAFVAAGVAAVTLLPHRHWNGIYFWMSFFGRESVSI